MSQLLQGPQMLVVKNKWQILQLETAKNTVSKHKFLKKEEKNY